MEDITILIEDRLEGYEYGKLKMTFSEVCRIVKVNDNILKRLLPVLSLKLKTRYDKHIDSDYQENFGFEWL